MIMYFVGGYDMGLFEDYKDRITKLNDVKYLKELKDSFDKGLYNDKNLTDIINENNELLKSILNDYIIQDLINWLENTIDNNESDRIKKFAEWLNTWVLYLKLESGFDSTKNRKYERGDIVHVNFGFNVCSELGGSHYGIIVDKNNDKTSETVVVIPLRSEDGKLKEEEVIKNLNKYEVLLGNNLIPIGEAKNNYSIAKVNQIRTVAKLRITAPRKENDTAYPLDKNIRTSILNKIDGEVKNMLLK